MDFLYFLFLYLFLSHEGGCEQVVQISQGYIEVTGRVGLRLQVGTNICLAAKYKEGICWFVFFFMFVLLYAILVGGMREGC